MTPDEITKRVNDRVQEELSSIDLKARYREMLDDIYSFDSIGGPFSNMQPSHVLEEVDPIAFRCGLSEMDTDGMEEIDGEYYDADKVSEIREEVKAEIEREEEAATETAEEEEADNESTD